MDLAKSRLLAGLLSEYLGQVVSTGKPYSKSHAKRLKRKAKEELAGGTLADIQSAIAAVESDHKILGEGTFTEPPKNEPPKPPTKKPNTGLIGEGNTMPPSQNQRKNALYASYSEP